MLSVSCLDHQLVSTLRGGKEKKTLLDLLLRQGYTLDGSPVYHMKHTHAHAHSEGWFRDYNQANVHVFGLWEGTGENPHKSCGNTQIAFQSCTGEIINTWASCSSNFKTRVFKQEFRKDKVLLAGAENRSIDYIAFISKGHFLCNNHIVALTFRNMTYPNIRININVVFLSWL